MDEKFSLSNDEHTLAKWQHIRQRSRMSLVPWLLHLLVIVIYTTKFVSLGFNLTKLSPNSLLPREMLSAREVAAYSTVEFAPFAFDVHTNNDYVGPPSPVSDAAWDRLLEVGIYSMTDEEYTQWGGATAQVAGEPDQHVVTIELFHQLHCMHLLRNIIYSPERNANPYNESHRGLAFHIDHCFDYIRRVIMCHGDLTPMPMSYNPEGHPTYAPQLSYIRSCRNFNQIFEFAAKGNRSGTQIEHEKVDTGKQTVQ
ncbi:hypothetical protein H2198_002275 [Neophaeococcomyces mojaviensis]|uniref:Uncharacterized protein n=1 Tax=Neophaeococcomyces mojaviensis TaxID=3383035 RepID=A0ACC3AEQ3_9EURO|nr:hypothetical protein H2198_002275 [Knufia sp. JES_112]